VREREVGRLPVGQARVDGWQVVSGSDLAGPYDRKNKASDFCFNLFSNAQKRIKVGKNV
jgi:hypothetical protein